jgi:hypothetical protein
MKPRKPQQKPSYNKRLLGPRQAAAAAAAAAAGPKQKLPSYKNRIRSIQRLLNKVWCSWYPSLRSTTALLIRRLPQARLGRHAALSLSGPALFALRLPADSQSLIILAVCSSVTTTQQEGLDPKVKAAKEAELLSLQQKQQQHQQTEREKRLATKYHKVGAATAAAAAAAAVLEAGARAAGAAGWARYQCWLRGVGLLLRWSAASILQS